MASNSDTGTCLMRTDVPELVKSVGDAMMAQLRKVTPEKGSKRPKSQITSIAEWVQCFGVFMAVVVSKSPD